MQNRKQQRKSAHKVGPFSANDPRHGSITDNQAEQLDATESVNESHSNQCLQQEIEQLRAELSKLKVDTAKEFAVLDYKAKIESGKLQPVKATAEEDHHFPEPVISRDQILKLQDDLTDFFCTDDLDGLKWDLQSFFTGWLASHLSQEMHPEDRAEKVMSYHKLMHLIENLAPINETLSAAYEKRLRAV